VSTGPVVVRVRALDVEVALEVSGAGVDRLLPDLEAAWAWCRAATDLSQDPDVTVKLSTEVGVVEPGFDLTDSEPDRLLHHLSTLVTMRAIEHQAGRLVLLHAGAVASPSGAVVGLVGPSGAGKTTAMHHLGARFGYVTDETLAVRPDGTVAGYPKPLSLVRDGLGHKEQVGPDALGLLAPPARCHLVGLILLDRDGTDPTLVETVPRLDALAMLAPHTSYLSRHDQPLHALAGLVDRVGGLRVAHYADREQLVEVVDGLLAGS
jgi:hypothetical protein